MISSITHTMVTFSSTQLHGNQNTNPEKWELARNSVHPSAVSLEVKYVMLAGPSHGGMLLSFYAKATVFFRRFPSPFLFLLPHPHFKDFTNSRGPFSTAMAFNWKINKHIYFLKGQRKGYFLLLIISLSHDVFHWTIAIIFIAQLISLTSRILMNFTKVNQAPYV